MRNEKGQIANTRGAVGHTQLGSPPSVNYSTFIFLLYNFCKDIPYNKLWRNNGPFIVGESAGPTGKPMLGPVVLICNRYWLHKQFLHFQYFFNGYDSLIDIIVVRIVDERFSGEPLSIVLLFNHRRISGWRTSGTFVKPPGRFQSLLHLWHTIVGNNQTYKKKKYRIILFSSLESPQLIDDFYAPIIRQTL